MINSSAILEINKKNLIHNYKSLAKIANNSLAGATIKANGKPNSLVNLNIFLNIFL